jgi:hypothetical protein
MIDVSNIFDPSLNLPYALGRELDFLVSPLQKGTKRGKNVIKITGYHF